MNDCTPLKENYEGYALGALDAEERAAIESHLARKCPTCTAEVESARWVVAQLAHLAPEAEPPAALRQRVLQSAGVTQLPVRRAVVPVWAWAGAVAALVLFSVFSARQVGELRQEVARLDTALQNETSRNSALAREKEHLERVTGIVSGVGTRNFLLKASEGDPVIQAYWHQTLGIVLAAHNLPRIAEDRTFQLWVVPKSGAPISAGIFRPGADGSALHLHGAAIGKLADASALAITNEPAGGRLTPTLPPIWSAPVAESK